MEPRAPPPAAARGAGAAARPSGAGSGKCGWPTKASPGAFIGKKGNGNGNGSGKEKKRKGAFLNMVCFFCFFMELFF